MHAMEVRRIEQAGDGEVVEELLGGFARDGDVLRLAEVAVNRPHLQE
jgi:molecular chaperone GrpE (heat shock protein)